jgi:acyl-CoA synthetase (NDP forming)
VSPASTRARLRRLLSPRSIALVGVTEGSAWSQSLVANLRNLGFKGRLHMVNPRYQEQFGQPCHPAVSSIPEPVDSAYVMTGTSTAGAIVEDCARKGVRSVTLLTAGYKETGPDGAQLEADLVRFCDSHDMGLLGPNCLGFVNYARRAAGYALQMPAPLLPGSIAMVTQSGAMLLAINRLASVRAVGLSYAVSCGNEAMLSGVDILDFFVSDPSTKVVGALLEDIRDPAAFRAVAARALEAGKPIVMLKIGRTEAGVRSTRAHTGALASRDLVVDGLLRQTGVIRVDSLEELVETCALLDARGWPEGRRFAMVTVSGGACGILADLTRDTRIEIPDFSDKTKQALAEALPVFGTPQNPLDTTGVIVLQPGLLGRCVQIVNDDPGFDGMLVNSDPPRDPGANAATADERLRALAAALDSVDKFNCVVAATASELTPFAHEAARRHKLHFVNGFQLGVRALDGAVWYGEARRRWQRSRADAEGARRRRDVAGLNGRSGPLSEVESKRVVAAYGIPLPVERLARDADEAARLATEVGFPAVLKIQSPDLPHKTEAGGVRLGLRSAEEVRQAFDGVVEAARNYSRDARIEGVLLARQVEPVVELAAGIATDPEFGPVVIAGLGGVLVEVIRDASARVPPITKEDAREMLEELRASELLAGFRGRPPGDVDAAADALVSLGRLALDLRDRLLELDLNPLFVMPRGQGVLAGDALVILK